ncbi:TIR domain-containing protein [Paenibacillus sp.]
MKQHHPSEYQYFAFISYSRKDKAWARWLQRQLESYRLPTRIIKKYENVPKRVTPVFRDETDLAGAILEQSLEKALTNSQYLIVISSPNSAQSEWVGKEVEAFRAMGREDHIIPFVVDGIPFSEDAALECFNEQLRTIEPVLLGVSAVELGKRKAFLRLVATMFHLQYDELLMRDRKRRVRNRIIFAVLACLLLTGVTAGIWYNTEHTTYYRSYITRYEMPEGVDRLSKQKRAGANTSYRFTTLRGKVIRVESVDSYGNVTNPMRDGINDDYPRLDYFYDSDGNLIHIEQRYATGEVASQKVLTHAGERIAIDYRTPGDALMSQAVFADQSYRNYGEIGANRSEIVRQINTYDENGLLVTAMYYRDALGNPACDTNGIYGKLYQYDTEGRVIAVSNLNELGEVYACKYGWATVRYEYNDQGQVTLESFYNAAGEAVLNQKGIWAESYEYDENGNIISVVFCDVEEQKTLSSDGICELGFIYDKAGKILRINFVDINGLPTTDSNGIHGYRYTYNMQGFRSSEVALDASGNPSNSWADLICARVEYEYDINGRVLFEYYFDAEGNPCCRADLGVFAIGITYDENGFRSSFKGYDAAMNVMTFSSGYAEERTVYSADGKPLRTEYLDEAGNLTRSSDNFAVWTFSYDRYGNLVSERYYDEKNEPCCNVFGYHGINWDYEDGLKVSESYIGTDGRAVVCADYYHALIWEYDEHGNCVGQKQLDVYGKMIENPSGYAEARKRYDEYGRVIEEAYYDRYGQLNNAAETYYRSVFTYDEAGNIGRQDSFYYDYYTQAEQHNVYLSEYDAYGNKTRSIFYDDVAQLTILPDGVTQTTTTYDQQGRIIRENIFYSSYDVTESVACTYDDHGYLVKKVFTTTDATGCETIVGQYIYCNDEFGRPLRQEYRDGTGALKESKYGYSIWVLEYTHQGYVCVEEYYDASGKPMLHNGAYFRVEYVRDAAGNPVEVRFYNTEKQLVSQNTGHHAVAIQEYDHRGNRVYYAAYDENGIPYLSPEDQGAAAARYYYSDTGLILSYELLAADDSLICGVRATAVIHEIITGSDAELLGIQTGDVVLSYGDWRYFDSCDPYNALLAEIRRTAYSGKKLLLCRMGENGYEIVPINSTNPSSLGIRIVGQWHLQPDVDAMQAAWEAYQQVE